jgi:hypothetical protein
MTLVVLVVVLGVALGSLAVFAVIRFRQGRSTQPETDQPTGRILFPFVANALSQRALDAALRLAKSEQATLVPVFLASVPLYLPLDTPLPHQCGIAIPLQEAIDRRATRFGIPVDARIERGRNHRHALRETIAHERFDRLVIAAATGESAGFDSNDVAWILHNVPGELVVLRPAKDMVLAAPSQQKRPRVPSRDVRQAAVPSPG